MYMPGSQVAEMRRIARIFTSFIALAAAQLCPIESFPEVTEGSWLPGVVYQAVIAGKPRVSVPLKIDGFNRTVTINGLGTLNSLDSSAFTPSPLRGGEVTALVAANGTNGSLITLNFLGATCTLHGISIYKTPPTPWRQASFEAELRLQFDKCVGGLPDQTAGVVIGLDKDISAKSTSDVLTWVKEAIQTAPTTTPPPVVKVSAVQNHKREEVLTTSGSQGKCKGKVQHQVKKATEDDCRQHCLGSEQVAELIHKKSQECDGYAFKAKGARRLSESSKDKNATTTAKEKKETTTTKASHNTTATTTTKSDANCVIYVGEVTEAEVDEGWVCYNMSINNTDAQKKPPKVIPQTTAFASLKDEFTKVASSQPLAYLMDMSAPVENASCFTPVWWFRLTDKDGKWSSFKLNEGVGKNDFTELLKLLPDPIELNKSTAISAPTVLDRVVVSSDVKPNSWSNFDKICYVPPAHVNMNCRTDEIANAMVTGLVTPTGTWLLVGVVFFLISGRPRRENYEPLQPKDAKPENHCGLLMVLVYSVIAVGGACLWSWAAFTFLNEILRSHQCYHGDEWLVIMVAAGLSAGLAIVIVIQYMGRQHPTHEHHLLRGTSAPPKRENRLMVVAMSDGQEAVPVPIESMGQRQTALGSRGDWGTLDYGRSAEDPMASNASSGSASAFQSFGRNAFASLGGRSGP
jgi:hypothetical protein